MNLISAVLPNNLLFNPTIVNRYKEKRNNKSSNKKGYLADSDFYPIKGGFEAEIIRDPGKKILEAGKLDLVINELGGVLLKAFEKKKSDSDEFLSGNKFVRVAIWVDWLVVVRKQGKPVAFGSGSFVSDNIFYINAGMSLPEYQSTGVGFVANTLLWDIALNTANDEGLVSPTIIVRTKNKNVCSIFLKVLKNATISTEKEKNLHTQMVLQKTANYLNCNIDVESGRSYDVYPEGLPAGTKTNCKRINEAFSEMGHRDACYVVGSLNNKLVFKLLRSYVKDYFKNEENKYAYEDLTACA